MDRREFFRRSALAGTGSLFLNGRTADAQSPATKEKVRFACIGVGGKGESDTNDAGAHGEIVALCDIDSHIAKCLRNWVTRSTP
jgi:hypothetical protein